MEKEQFEQYAQLYIQKQEAVVVEYLRKSIDFEIQSMSLRAKIKELEEKYAESQKQVELQNDMMGQAAKGLEGLKIEKEYVEKQREELSARVTELENRIHAVISEKNQAYDELSNAKDSMNISKRELNDIKKELVARTDELNEVYRENKELKSKLPTPPKKKTVSTEKSVDTF